MLESEGMKSKNRNVNRYIKRHYEELLAFSPRRISEMDRQERQAVVLKHRRAMFAARANG